MSKALGIRLDRDVLNKIDALSKEEHFDRSTTIRRLISRGYQEFVKEKASRNYVEGKITLSEAARRANVTIWEMEHYIVDKGFKSIYSLEDLKKEAGIK